MFWQQITRPLGSLLGVRMSFLSSEMPLAFHQAYPHGSNELRPHLARCEVEYVHWPNPLEQLQETYFASM